MAKARVITALALTVVMLVAMPGLAAAQSIQSCDASGNPKDIFGINDRIYVTGINLSNASNVGKIWIVENCDWGDGYNQSNLSEYSYHKGSYPDVFVTGIGASGGKFTPNDPVDICAVTNLSGVYPDYYDIIYDVDGDGLYDYGTDLVDKFGCQGFETIPEFATIAIPVAAILGLLFFYSHRKRKEE